MVPHLMNTNDFCYDFKRGASIVYVYTKGEKILLEKVPHICDDMLELLHADETS